MKKKIAQHNSSILGPKKTHTYIRTYMHVQTAHKAYVGTVTPYICSLALTQKSPLTRTAFQFISSSNSPKMLEERRRKQTRMYVYIKSLQRGELSNIRSVGERYPLTVWRWFINYQALKLSKYKLKVISFNKILHPEHGSIFRSECQEFIMAHKHIQRCAGARALPPPPFF